MTKEEFIEKYCKNCKEICDEGITETKATIYCKDINIKENKS